MARWVYGSRCDQADEDEGDSKVKHEFKFKLGARIVIKDLEGQKAVIESRMNALDSEDQYKVVYWYNGERKSVWVNAREIKLKG